MRLYYAQSDFLSSCKISDYLLFMRPFAVYLLCMYLLTYLLFIYRSQQKEMLFALLAQKSTMFSLGVLSPSSKFLRTLGVMESERRMCRNRDMVFHSQMDTQLNWNQSTHHSGPLISALWAVITRWVGS